MAAHYIQGSQYTPLGLVIFFFWGGGVRSKGNDHHFTVGSREPTGVCFGHEPPKALGDVRAIDSMPKSNQTENNSVQDHGARRGYPHCVPATHPQALDASR